MQVNYWIEEMIMNLPEETRKAVIQRYFEWATAYRDYLSDTIQDKTGLEIGDNVEEIYGKIIKTLISGKQTLTVQTTGRMKIGDINYKVNTTLKIDLYLDYMGNGEIEINIRPYIRKLEVVD